ncbi:hypothetical protein [Streptomyces caeruleatus]|uniref:hypothetical protein n=1 Tax=Streptomyces caeruleatus TaxID=661399 RepID=UPI000AECC075|nr:hypothetical protein [Streptomyces caeruleatus]
MRRLIGRLFRRRPRRHPATTPVGPTVRHIGARPAQAAHAAVVLGVGVGSVGLPSWVVGGAK